MYNVFWEKTKFFQKNLIFFLCERLFICDSLNERATMTIRTYNARLSVTEQQREFWAGLLAQARDAFNLCSKMTEEQKLPYSRVAIHNACYDTLRKKFPSLSSQQVIRVQCDVCSAFKSRKSNGHHGERPTKRGLSMTLDKRLYGNLTSESVSLTGANRGKRETYGIVGYGRLHEMFMSYPAGDPSIFMRGGELYISIPFEVQSVPCSNTEAVGVDLGIKRLFVTSDGNAFVDRVYLKERRKLRYLKRCLQAKKTRSSRRHQKKVSRRERHMSKDMVHRAVKSLMSSTEAGIIVIEDLKKIKKNTSVTRDGFRRKRHNSMLGQVPFHMFKEWLTHKAQLVGRRVETVSPTYTSQTDSRTGKRDGQRMGCRYVCSDGAVLDADWNAAVNIAHRANHPVSKVLPVDGGLRFLTGRVRSITRTPEASRLNGKPISL